MSIMMHKYFRKLMNHKKKISARTKNIMIPGAPKEYSALQVKEIRARNNCSQKFLHKY